MTGLIGIAAVALVAWFAAGTVWNVAKGRAVLSWMQDGLPALGERTTVRWLGSTAVELVIREARAPFASASVVVFLEPRDLPWMWGFGRIRGRRDTLIVRGALRSPPTVEFEALAPASWSGREALGRVPREWPVRGAGPGGRVVIHHANAGALARADELLDLAGRAGLAVRRLAVRRTEPHLQFHVGLPDSRRSARDFFAAVQALAAIAERAPD